VSTKNYRWWQKFFHETPADRVVDVYPIRMIDDVARSLHHHFNTRTERARETRASRGNASQSLSDAIQRKCSNDEFCAT
jgi:trehalose utilization protein